MCMHRLFASAHVIHAGWLIVCSSGVEVVVSDNRICVWTGSALSALSSVRALRWGFTCPSFADARYSQRSLLWAPPRRTCRGCVGAPVAPGMVKSVGQRVRSKDASVAVPRSALLHDTDVDVESGTSRPKPPRLLSRCSSRQLMALSMS